MKKTKMNSVINLVLALFSTASFADDACEISLKSAIGGAQFFATIGINDGNARILGDMGTGLNQSALDVQLCYTPVNSEEITPKAKKKGCAKGQALYEVRLSNLSTSVKSLQAKCGSQGRMVWFQYGSAMDATYGVQYAIALEGIDDPFYMVHDLYQGRDMGGFKFDIAR